MPVLEAQDQGNRTYNPGNGSGFSVGELIDVARLITGRPIPAEYVLCRAGDVPTMVGGSQKIRNELG
jgi:UDP-glucose 4-epimerase